MIKAVLFDMDGVLVDTEWFYNRRRVAFMEEKGFHFDEIPDLSGSNEPAIWEALVPDDVELRERLRVEYKQVYSPDHPVPYAELLNEQTEPVMRALHERGVKCAIASSSYRELIDELVEIAQECAKCARTFGVDPKVAFLSYSTLGSGKGEDVDKMRNACEKAKALMPDTPIGGEFQFDAAVSPAVAKTKHITDAVGGHANTFIFPDINAGNIGYKIAQRLGSFDAYGPILLGLNAPINDLSRGCNAQEVYSMAIITAALA